MTKKDRKTNVIWEKVGGPLFALSALFMVGTYWGCGENPEPAQFAQNPEMDQRVPEGVYEALLAGEPQELIVTLYDTGVEDEVTSAQRANGTTSDYDDYLHRKQSIYAQQKAQVLASLPPDSGFLLQDYPHLPIAVVEIDTVEGLESLLIADDVKSLHIEEYFTANLAQSLPLIDQPETSTVTGKRGEGTAVAVLDTGVNYTLSAFGSCSSPGGACKVAYAIDTAANDSKLDADGHGTNVAGIVLGVAPETKIIAMDVFQGSSASSTDIIEAIDWVIANRATYNIVSMNMSLGGGAYQNECAGSVFTSAIANAKSAGVLSAIATGNDGYTNKVAQPACVPGVVSVGAVYDGNYGKLVWSNCTDSKTVANKVTCFSNATSWITMLAPGALIQAAGITQGGTSQATPHVAGAIAVLRGAFSGETLTETVTRLTSSGKVVTDWRTGKTYPRLDLDDAAAGSPSTPTPTPVPTPTPGAGTPTPGLTPTPAPTPTAAPTPTMGLGANRVAINSGDTYAKSYAVTLTFSREDETLIEMCVSNSTSCSSWKSYRSSLSWSLSSGNGKKTVNLWYRDAAKTISTKESDTIIVDGTNPTNGSVVVTPGDAEVDISWSGATDKNSGLAAYKLVYSNSATPTSCAKGYILEDETTATSHTHTGLTNGNTYYYRLCSIDNAGNFSSGLTFTSRPAPEFDGPEGTVSINSADSHTKSASVSLSLVATDVSDIISVCISNSNTCSSWSSFNATKNWNLLSGNGNRTVYVWFRDQYKNVSSAYVTDAIYLDTTKPKDGALVITPSDASVDLSWSGFSDKESGLASYKLVYGMKSVPTDCTKGYVAVEGNVTSYQHTSLTNGSAYYYRLCAVDNASNYSLGTSGTGIPAPEFNAPTSGAVVINSDDTYGTSTAVSLALSATDANTISAVCISNSNSCTNWLSMNATRNWTLNAGSGNRVVYVWFRDEWGNKTTSPVTDNIYLDTVVPKNGTGNISAGDTVLSVDWSGFSDKESGLASYKLVYGNTSNPTNCNKGYIAYEGTNTSYSHTGLTNGNTYYYRICAIDNAGNMSAGSTFSGSPTPETAAPTAGTVVINNGDTYAKSNQVSLTVAATDVSGIAQMCVSNSNSCTAWVTFSTAKNWSLSGGEGNRTVYVWFKDAFGNVTTSAATDSIQLDTSAPSKGQVVIVPGDTQLDLSWINFSDSRSGLASYKLVYGYKNSPTDCTKGYVAYEGLNTTYSHTGLTNGQKIYYTLCATDNAGNTSYGVFIDDIPAPEFDAPASPTVVINSGDVWTSKQSVTLTLSATDASTIAKICISNSNSCTNWVGMVPSKAWTLNGGNGNRTVYVWFKDQWGNTTTVATTDVIKQDLTQPKNGTLTASSGVGQVDFAWAGFSDKESGLDTYKLVYGNKNYPSNCSKGYVAYEGTATSYSHTGLASGTTRYYRLCAKDVAGNVSSGAWAAGTVN